MNYFVLLTYCFSTSWYSQQYTRGSYTAIAVGSSQLDIEYIAQPIYLDEHESKVRAVVGLYTVLSPFSPSCTISACIAVRWRTRSQQLLFDSSWSIFEWSDSRTTSFNIRRSARNSCRLWRNDRFEFLGAGDLFGMK